MRTLMESAGIDTLKVEINPSLSEFFYKEATNTLLGTEALILSGLGRGVANQVDALQFPAYLTSSSQCTYLGNRVTAGGSTVHAVGYTLRDILNLEAMLGCLEVIRRMPNQNSDYNSIPHPDQTTLTPEERVNFLDGTVAALFPQRTVLAPGCIEENMNYTRGDWDVIQTSDFFTSMEDFATLLGRLATRLIDLYNEMRHSESGTRDGYFVREFSSSALLAYDEFIYLLALARMLTIYYQSAR